MLSIIGKLVIMGFDMRSNDSQDVGRTLVQAVTKTS